MHRDIHHLWPMPCRGSSCPQGVGGRHDDARWCKDGARGGEHLTRLPSRTHNTSDPRCDGVSRGGFYLRRGGVGLPSVAMFENSTRMTWFEVFICCAFMLAR